MSVQLITYAIIGYGAPYLFNYTKDKIANTILNKTTTVVKKKVTDVIYRNNKPIETEYEYINIDNNGNIISEPIMFVTSNKNSLIDQSWNDISMISSKIENKTENKHEYKTNEYKRLGSTASLSSLKTLSSTSPSPSPSPDVETLLGRTLSHSAIEEYIKEKTV